MILLKQAALGLALALAMIIIIAGAGLTATAETLLGVAHPAEYHLGVETICIIPAGWHPYQVQAGDSLASLAASAPINMDKLITSNCLTEDIKPGETIYLPIRLPETISTACGPPPGWGFYITTALDDPTRLAYEYGISKNLLLQANCLNNTITLPAGMRLYLPITPTYTLEPIISATHEATQGTSPTVEETLEPTPTP